ncbi:MAG: helix-turn-helix transcriptional regulator [Firmicutes bacterium]|nr:helix-turn-helix transcriptional regulator [Bacillota bacterium]
MEVKIMTLNRAFSVRLLKLTRNKMSKSRLERESGLSTLTLKHIENGTIQDIKLSHVVKVAKVLKMSLSEFFDDEVFDWEC